MGFDFSRKVIDIRPPMMITGDIESELLRVKQAVAHAVGKNPQHA
ncbi:hypothetical protein [Pseudidiomarina halophila]